MKETASPPRLVFVSPPSNRQDDKVTPPCPSKEIFDNMPNLSVDELKDLGLIRWNKNIFLFPFEWHGCFPNDLLITFIDSEPELVKNPNLLDDDRRFGALSYGIKVSYEIPTEYEYHTLPITTELGNVGIGYRVDKFTGDEGGLLLRPYSVTVDSTQPYLLRMVQHEDEWINLLDDDSTINIHTYQTSLHILKGRVTYLGNKLPIYTAEFMEIDSLITELLSDFHHSVLSFGFLDEDSIYFEIPNKGRVGKLPNSKRNTVDRSNFYNLDSGNTIKGITEIQLLLFLLRSLSFSEGTCEPLIRREKLESGLLMILSKFLKLFRNIVIQ